MKRLRWGVAAVLIAAFSVARLSTRWREESADHHLAVLVDWSEVRDTAMRQGLTDEDLLQRLRNAGANTLLVGASTVQDYLMQQSPAEQTDLVFSSRIVAETVLRQLQERGVAGVSLQRKDGHFRLQNTQGHWQRLKDLEVGFNPELLGMARQAGFHLVLRINNDPWLSKDALLGDLQEIASANQDLGVLLNTDEVPGGPDALLGWASFLESQNYLQLLFEFHPSKSSVKVGFLSPRSTYRAHTIAPNELKDLLPAQQLSRWRRAVQERSCRFLLLHVSAADSLGNFLENVTAVQQDFFRHGWTLAWPKPRPSWSVPSFAERHLAPVLALILAILLPVLALQYSLAQTPWVSYGRLISLTFLGACIVAAAAQNSWTRLEIVPFRGIKMAFALAWLGSIAVLYPWKEIKTELYRAVRRVDILVGLGVLAVIGYVLVRTGNASAGWKTGWEQGFRDRLENMLIARPRFKEFAVGYPLLILGLHLKRTEKPKVFWQDRRFWMALGMIGPISMINTFCHLHSPLYLAMWRSANGVLLGTALGLGLLAAKKCLS